MTRARAFRQLEGEKTRGMLAVEAAVREVKESAADEARQLRAELAHAQRDNGKHVVQIRQMERQLAAGAHVWSRDRGDAGSCRCCSSCTVALVAALPWVACWAGAHAGPLMRYRRTSARGVACRVCRVPCALAMMREAVQCVASAKRQFGNVEALGLGSLDLPARPPRVS